MKPYQVLSEVERQLPDSPDYDKWCMDIYSFLTQEGITPFHLAVPVGAEDMALIRPIAEWVWNEASDFMDHLPPYTTVENEKGKTIIRPDVDAARVSPDVYEFPRGESISNGIIPDKYHFAMAYSPGEFRTLYQKTHLNTWRSIWKVSVE